MAAWVFRLWWVNYCGLFGRCGWPLVLLVSRPCLVWRLPATGWQDQVTRHLAVEPQVVLGLVLAHHWVEPGSVMGGCWTRLSRSWVGPIPDMVGCSFQGVPNLLLVHR